jgi:hypothetical protein
MVPLVMLYVPNGTRVPWYVLEYVVTQHRKYVRTTRLRTMVHVRTELILVGPHRDLYYGVYYGAAK